jgi:hypothetical protein
MGRKPRGLPGYRLGLGGVKFESGDETEKWLVVSLQHEFLRCQEAFKEFADHATDMVFSEHSRKKSYLAYNAYSRFILHLYEFLIGCIKRDRQNTANIPAADADHIIQSEAQKANNRRRQAILKGYASPHENGIDAYPENIPTNFGSMFRKHRNQTLGHVSPARAELNLTDFFDRYHTYLMLIYHESHFAWQQKDADFPDLQEITNFGLTVSRKLDPQ